ncbi:hypothetical protein [Streptomyces sp. V3I7]|uniref:hypothetical protein n=1 Tax=Streptomyces sp. V3I7 TaxID=3042278 RepID=UPI00277F778D|nr:hypothetical protein [Streptomyces sp. V3I7]MDQ0992190.1 hypothetical protein [Streptomyces sp. V3I7]
MTADDEKGVELVPTPGGHQQRGVLTDCGLCERPIERGYLCPGDTLALAERLDRMPKLYAGLAAFLQPGGRRPEYGRTRPAEAPLPVSEHVFNLRGPGGLVSVLEDWRSAMQADRGWGQPVIEGSTERRIVVAARALSLNLEWIASSWPMAGAFAEEIRDLEGAVASIVNPRDPAERPKRLGLCPTVVDDEDGKDVRCGAVLLLRPRHTAVSCSWCGASWEPSRWLDLARAQKEVEDAANAPEGAHELRELQPSEGA